MCTVGGIYALRRLQTVRIIELARRALLPARLLHPLRIGQQRNKLGVPLRLLQIT